MSYIASFCARLVMIGGFVAVGLLTSAAQATIFNIPSAETLPAQTFQLEGEFTSKPVRFRDGGYRTYGYRTVYGLNNKTDVGANFYFSQGADGPIGEMQFHAKRMLHRSERRGLAFSAGVLAYFPLRDSLGARAGALVYVNGSKTLKRAGGLRLTSGAYHIVRGDRGPDTRTGAMLGVEQPITERISLLADWSSGQNRFGYSGAGVNYQITPRQYLTGGYSFGNSGRGNNALSLSYGYTF